MKKLLFILCLLFSFIFSQTIKSQIDLKLSNDILIQNPQNNNLLLKFDKNKEILGNSTISATLGFKNFIQGITPIINKFSTQNEPTNAGICLFIYLDQNNNPLEKAYGIKVGNHWYITHDMGIIRTDLKISLAAGFYTTDSTFIESTKKFDLGIIPKPEWLNQADTSNINLLNKIIDFDASLPVNHSFADNIPDSIQALNGRQYSFDNVKINCHISYNLSNGVSTVSNPKLVFSLNILDQDYESWSMPLGDGSEFSLDSNFDLVIKLTEEGTSNQFNVNLPSLYFPIAGPLSLTIDAGLNLALTVDGKIIIGNQNGQWGFIRSGLDVTSISAKIEGSAYVSGEFSVLCGAASATGTLIVNGKIGGGFEYTSIPQENITTIFGGDIAVSGQIKLKTLWGFGDNWTYNKEFYHGNFGNFPGLIVKKGDENEYAILANTKKLNISLMPPESYPQPNFCSKNNFGAVWVENIGNKGFLLLSIYDKASNKF